MNIIVPLCLLFITPSRHLRWHYPSLLNSILLCHFILIPNFKSISYSISPPPSHSFPSSSYSYSLTHIPSLFPLPSLILPPPSHILSSLYFPFLFDTPESPTYLSKKGSLYVVAATISLSKSALIFDSLFFTFFVIIFFSFAVTSIATTGFLTFS